MDKLLNTPLFVKIISLLLAFMLYLAVNMDTPDSQQGQGAIPGTNENDETVLDVALDASYDESKYVVSGLPSSVTVSLTGPSSAITTTRLQRKYEVFVNLEGLKPGSHQVKIQHRNFSDKLAVSLEPSTATVTIQEKVSKIMQVDVDFINEKEMEDGYTVEQPIVSPNSVKVTGAKEAIEDIAIVKAIVDLKSVKETATVDAPVRVYDQAGEEVPVTVEPSVVEVKVPVSSPSAVVPFKINRKGDLPEGLSVNSFDVEPSEITIFAPNDVLEKIEYIDDVTIDLSEITKDTVMELDIPIPDGVKRIDPEKVKVTIDVEAKADKTFTSLPIEVVGLSSDLSASFTGETNTADLVIYGSESVLKDITAEDIEIYADLSGYSKGTHDVKLEVNGPQNITWSLDPETAEIQIQ
ncbi:CdaR family protein [Bacillus marinisedimentorum]|uniref:CdaR family protein n=1 Tax=Bacillus marinisedimentorum TaxID=1821260 RepID=UPI0007E093AC|nr:CdaR family protein [Bacillus marinisedimentorum]